MNTPRRSKPSRYWPSKESLNKIILEFHVTLRDKANEQILKKNSAFNNFFRKVIIDGKADRTEIESEDIKDQCRQINLTMQTKQPCWEQMAKIKEMLDQVAEIEISIKKEEANKGSDADFTALSELVDQQRKSGHHSHYYALPSLRSKEEVSANSSDGKEESSISTFHASAEGGEIKESNDKISDSPQVSKFAAERISRLKETKQRRTQDVKVIREGIDLHLTEGVDSHNDKADLFPRGPVGDSPLHGCFLLGLHDLGFEVIKKFCASPELLSMRYINDLDIWRGKNGNIQEERVTEPRPNLSHDENEPHSFDELEDGLYTGETILHIAIVQEQEHVVQKLLKMGIEVSTPATGVFFQPRFQQPRSTDLTFLQHIKARIIGIDLDLERFAAVNRIENTHSGCYYGEFPLSFAASVGNVNICDQLYCCWRTRVDAMISFQKDSQKEPLCKLTSSEKEKMKGIIESLLETTHPETPRNASAALFSDTSFMRRNSHKNFNSRLKSSDDENLILDRLMWNFVNAADSFGNTAMHMAVIHGQTKVIDWLMKLKEGKEGMELFNHEGFTPLTLAARYGKVDVFHHILYQHMSTTAWVYGQVMLIASPLLTLSAIKVSSRHLLTQVGMTQVRMIRTDLAQVDTYYRKIDDKKWCFFPRLYGRKVDPDDRSLETKTAAKELNRDHGSSAAAEANGQRDPGSQEEQETLLHHNRLWRCALEVIVDHEVQEFVKDELFHRLINDKWSLFGRSMYIKRTVLPYMMALAVLLVTCFLRGFEIKAGWPYVPADSNSAASVMCLQRANMSNSAAFIAWVDAELPAEGFNAVSSIATMVMNLLLVVLCAPFLLWKGWRQRRFRIHDLDTNADAQISVEEIMLFVQKNLHFAFDVFGAVFIICAAAARLACKDSAELNLLAIACIMLCFNLINVLLPFRFFGPIAIMMYKILREDVGRFVSIYLIVITGFSWGLFLLFQRSPGQQGCALPGAGGCSDPNEPEPYVYSGVGNSIFWLGWVSLGDSVGAIQVGHAPFLVTRWNVQKYLIGCCKVRSCAVLSIIFLTPCDLPGLL